MSETSGVPEAVRLLERAIFGLRVDRLFERDLRNDEVLSVLAEVRAVLLDVMPEWAEVTVSEVIGERDRARGLAVRLEQELAEAEGWVEAYRKYVRTLESRLAETEQL